ncbi:hypothetical protein [Sinomonas sp. G460-2]|uniref:hypothetical protein n=1 Tax=Sinomonas sp. G460-2 TaxID=3393464 RepID=UPI0039EEACE9
MELGPSGSRFSDDGQWWWDGRGWLPAVSMDRTWRFDGQRWRRSTSWRAPSKWALFCAPVWAFVLLVWAPIAVAPLSTPDGGSGPDPLAILLAVLASLVVATAVLGFLFGVTTQLRWIWAAAVLGTWAQLAGYVIAQLMQPQPGGAEDHAAAVGLIMFSMPTLLAITGLLWAGAGAGRLAHWVRRRRSAALTARR